jgi:hypothetical protein
MMVVKQGFAIGANQSYGGMASPRAEEEKPSNEALNEDQGNSGDCCEYEPAARLD